MSIVSDIRTAFLDHLYARAPDRTPLCATSACDLTPVAQTRRQLERLMHAKTLSLMQGVDAASTHAACAYLEAAAARVQIADVVDSAGVRLEWPRSLGALVEMFACEDGHVAICVSDADRRVCVLLGGVSVAWEKTEDKKDMHGWVVFGRSDERYVDCTCALFRDQMVCKHVFVAAVVAIGNLAPVSLVTEETFIEIISLT